MQECLAAIGRQFKIQVHALIEIGVDLGTVALGDGHIIPGFLVCAIDEHTGVGHSEHRAAVCTVGAHSGERQRLASSLEPRGIKGLRHEVARSYEEQVAGRVDGLGIGLDQVGGSPAAVERAEADDTCGQHEEEEMTAVRKKGRKAGSTTSGATRRALPRRPSPTARAGPQSPCG